MLVNMTGKDFCTATGGRGQRGVFLIEALIGILIFSLGILSLVAIQTAAMSAQNDAQFRIEAANYADQIMSQIWLNVKRNSGTVDTVSLGDFQHQATGAASSCDFSGDTAANALVAAWSGLIAQAGTGLPGSTAAMHQILVDTAAYNKVTVTVCWKSPLDAGPHHHTLVSFIN